MTVREFDTYRGIYSFSASLTCGFYDQAHFSKTFKERLGISPSEAYNSRMLQD
ncbi:AraC family transcriptional regulator [Tunicatimonas pelagia]|uniref:AraC family transcriptional regulator n=1 Tax=Tunicatimonas pelagia TaxID=931531 RepID=UPI00345DFF13